MLINLEHAGKKAKSFLIQSLQLCIASNRKRAGSHYRHKYVLLYVSGILTYYFSQLFVAARGTIFN
jgi:hypothetical protein